MFSEYLINDIKEFKTLEEYNEFKEKVSLSCVAKLKKLDIPTTLGIKGIDS